MAAFGLPFFAAGIFMILCVAGVIPISNASEMPRWGWVAMVFMGLAFTAVGGTLVFGRAWTTLDVTRRLVIKQWGLLIPLREHRLADQVFGGHARLRARRLGRRGRTSTWLKRTRSWALQLYHVCDGERVRDRGRPTSSSRDRGFDIGSSRPCHTGGRRTLFPRAGHRVRARGSDGSSQPICEAR